MITKDTTLKKKILKKSVELLLSSTSHGLPNIFRAKRLFIKVMWLILFIIGTLLGIFTVLEAVNTYLKHEIVTKIDVIKDVPADCKCCIK